MGGIGFGGGREVFKKIHKMGGTPPPPPHTLWETLKRGGVCIYYKESLAVCLVDITSLLECLVCELAIQNKKG